MSCTIPSTRLELKTFAVEWALRYAVYGLFLGDLTLVTPVENEIIVLASVLPSGGSPTQTHMAVLLQLGVSTEEGDKLLDMCKKILQWAKVDTSSVPRYGDLVR